MQNHSLDTEASRSCAARRTSFPGRICTIPGSAHTSMSTEIVSDPRLGIPVAPSQAVGLHMHTTALESYRLPRQSGRRLGRDGIVHVSSRGDYLLPGGIRICRKRAEPAAGSHTAARRRWSVLRLSGLLMLVHDSPLFTRQSVNGCEQRPGAVRRRESNAPRQY